MINASDDPGMKILTSDGGRQANALLAQGHITRQEIAGADHTFTSWESRSQLLDSVASRILEPASEQAA